MSASEGDNRHHELLGMSQQICRRDFWNSTLLASGGLLLESLTPQQLLVGDDWNGYGGVGDYAHSNGNIFEVLSAGHPIRDRVFDSSPADAINTGELFECVVAGEGSAGWRPRSFSNSSPGN